MFKLFISLEKENRGRKNKQLAGELMMTQTEHFWGSCIKVPTSLPNTWQSLVVLSFQSPPLLGDFPIMGKSRQSGSWQTLERGFWPWKESKGMLAESHCNGPWVLSAWESQSHLQISLDSRFTRLCCCSAFSASAGWLILWIPDSLTPSYLPIPSPFPLSCHFTPKPAFLS